MAQEGWGSRESQVFLRETTQGSEFHSLHKHHDLTSCVFLQACSATGGTRCWCHHWTLSDGEPSCTSAPGSAQPEGDSAVANQTQCHKQGLEQMVGCPRTAWRKRQQQDKVMMWIGPALRATAGPGREHSQHCPSFSPQPACRAHVVWTNGLHKILLAERWYHRLYLCPL